MASASVSGIGYTADGTPMASASTPDSIPTSLPPLIPPTDRPQPASSRHASAPPTHATDSSKEVPVPLDGSAYHAYLAYSDDKEAVDNASDDDNDYVRQTADTTVARGDDGDESDNDDNDIADEEQFFRVPQPSVDTTNTADATDEDTVNVAPIARDAASPPDTVAPVAKCDKKTGPTPSPAVTPTPTTPSTITDSYYMRVARILLGIILVLVVGYVVYWILANVFGIDLWERTVGQVWRTDTSEAGAPELATVASNGATEGIKISSGNQNSGSENKGSQNSGTENNNSNSVPSWINSLFPSPFGKPPLGTSPVDKPPLSTTLSANATTPAGVVEIATREGQVLRKELTDKTAATLLDMMAAVKRG